MIFTNDGGHCWRERVSLRALDFQSSSCSWSSFVLDGHALCENGTRTALRLFCEITHNWINDPERLDYRVDIVNTK
jgi:hypothetical protein